MKLRLLEIEEEKKALKMKATLVKKDLKISDEQPLSSLRSAIEKAAQEGEFNSESESEIFKKVANDLLDADMEVKILAAVELGKMKNQAALPILLEALKFDNLSLTSEIKNALRNIDANSAIPLLKEVMDIETMKPESVTEDASLEETVVEETEGAESGKRGAKQTIYASEKLSNLLKEELLKICKKKNIECEKRLTKVEIIKLILEKQAML